VCRYAVVYAPVRLKTIGRITKDSLKFSSLGAYDGKYRCPKFEDAVHEDDEAVVCRVIWDVFFRFLHELGGTIAPFFCV
jgi:hypothetical protein